MMFAVFRWYVVGYVDIVPCSRRRLSNPRVELLISEDCVEGTYWRIAEEDQSYIDIRGR